MRLKLTALAAMQVCGGQATLTLHTGWPTYFDCGGTMKYVKSGKAVALTDTK